MLEHRLDDSEDACLSLLVAAFIQSIHNDQGRELLWDLISHLLGGKSRISVVSDMLWMSGVLPMVSQ